ncbi:hypothetical protein BGZ54_003641 [Gamsiella multidivaricata]|nr:hypothetical protein BGZ54_003641 [Gamsiella multidivaricata]
MEFSGWTDQGSIDTFIAYLRKLLQNEDARHALDKLLPPEAFEMMMEKPVGRSRPIVTTTARIIGTDKPEAWRDTIEETERRLVSWDLRNHPENLIYELVRSEDKYHRNLASFPDLQLVERAFSRIKIVERQARPVLDEAFVLKAAENYFRVRDSGFMKTTDWWVQQPDRAQTRGYA